MAEMTPNERAFIKVCEELIRKQNDLDALKKLESAANSINDWGRKNLSGLGDNSTHSDEIAGLSRIVNLMCNISDLRAYQAKTQERVEQLKDMADTYLKGQDIVAHRLMKD